MKKGLAFSKSEKREGWKTEEEKTREKVHRSLGFLVFHFLSKALSRESYNRRMGFSFLVKQGESTVRERLSLKVRLHLGRERLGCRRPPWSFFLPYTCICIFIYSDFMNDERCV